MAGSKNVNSFGRSLSMQRRKVPAVYGKAAQADAFAALQNFSFVVSKRPFYYALKGCHSLVGYVKNRLFSIGIVAGDKAWSVKTLCIIMQTFPPAEIVDT